MYGMKWDRTWYDDNHVISLFLFFSALVDSDSEIVIKPYEAIIFRNGAGLMSVSFFLLLALVMLNVLYL